MTFQDKLDETTKMAKAHEAQAKKRKRAAKTFQRESAILEPHQWQELLNMARKLDCKSVRGPKAGAYSWRVMLRQISNGELVVSRPENGEDGKNA